MKLYKPELDIAGVILENTSVAYCSTIFDHSLNSTLAFDQNIDVPVTPDLFFTKSILVSSNWNKNDDVFRADEIWKARKTPVDKPTNRDHLEDDIVGHITSTWAMDGEGNLIEDDIDPSNLPDFFHICNAAVIYKHWRNDENKKRANALIAAIVDGKKFVSMECYFTDFDYAMRNGDEMEYIERNEETAFLTKHLAIYGGAGEYQGKRLGRVPKNILFSGKGYVDRPANENSVILDYNGVNKNSAGVYTLCKLMEHDMSHENETIIADLKSEIEQLKADNKALQDSISKVTSQNLESQVISLQEELSVANASANALKKAGTEVADKYVDLQAQFDAVTKELTEVRASQKLTARVAQFINLGYTAEEAQTEVESLNAVSDESFAKIVKLIESRPKVDENAASSRNLSDGSESDPASNGVEQLEAEAQVTTAGVNASTSESDELSSSFASYIQELLSLEKDNGAEVSA